MKYANMKDFTFEEAKEEFEKLKDWNYDLKPIEKEMERLNETFKHLIFEAEINTIRWGRLVLLGQFWTELKEIKDLKIAYENSIEDTYSNLYDEDEENVIDSVKWMTWLKRKMLKFNLKERIEFYKDYPVQYVRFLIKRAIEGSNEKIQ